MKPTHTHISHHICILNAFINHSKPRLLVMFSLLLDFSKYFGFCGLNPKLITKRGCLRAPAQDQRLAYYPFVRTVCKKMIGTPQSWSMTEQTMSILQAQEWKGTPASASKYN